MQLPPSLNTGNVQNLGGFANPTQQSQRLPKSEARGLESVTHLLSQLVRMQQPRKPGLPSGQSGLSLGSLEVT